MLPIPQRVVGIPADSIFTIRAPPKRLFTDQTKGDTTSPTMIGEHMKRAFLSAFVLGR
ncbi:uncharacterized protein METZ01_LOCUS233320 [marine metagenome]|uniref:Uncharacterized protein n=1 Tax=marine metagenome TaxID=408172 RepID=A0A382GZF1_9ZZZZ